MNLRGQIISVIDLRKKLKIKSKESEEAVVMVNVQGISIGLIVDSINKVLNFSFKDVVELPEVSSQVSGKYIQGIFKSEKNLTVLLDLEIILNIAEIQNISAQRAA